MSPWLWLSFARNEFDMFVEFKHMTYVNVYMYVYNVALLWASVCLLNRYPSDVYQTNDYDDGMMYPPANEGPYSGRYTPMKEGRGTPLRRSNTVVLGSRPSSRINLGTQVRLLTGTCVLHSVRQFPYLFSFYKCIDYNVYQQIRVEYSLYCSSVEYVNNLVNLVNIFEGYIYFNV